MKRKTILFSILICLAVVALASAYASSHPDGLEWAAEKLGFAGMISEKSAVSSPFPDYALLPIRSPFWSTFFAGTIGMSVVFSAFWIFGLVLKRRNKIRNIQ